ncbi:hypothetical protein [Patulibacter defluvii]|uniref:hypothetical protein n=1 Tax=Patulibacter defluvii TaxID=3095358 RepID=UPI002A748F36|nr:hypothetical protein [Patulibacter sp. DM4]
MTAQQHDPRSPLTYEAAARFLNHITLEMRKAEAELTAAHVEWADRERDYRVGQAKAWSTIEGRSALEREARVKAECADLRRARDIATGRIASAKAALSRLDREAASCRFLGAWAQSERGSA